MRVIHFEIAADEVNRAIRFYSNVFGWVMRQSGTSEEYWHATTGENEEFGINGAIIKRTNPLVGTVNTIEVPSFEQLARKIMQHGGKVSERITIPGTGDFAYCEDTEGNVFGIIEKNKLAGQVQ